MAKGAEKNTEKAKQPDVQGGDSALQQEAIELWKDASKVDQSGKKERPNSLPAVTIAATNDISDGDFDAAANSQRLFPQLFDMNGVSREKQSERIESIRASINDALEDGNSQFRVRFGDNIIKTPGGRNLEIYDKSGATVDSLDFVIPNFQWR